MPDLSISPNDPPTKAPTPYFPIMGATIARCADCDGDVIIVDTLESVTWSFYARCHCRTVFIQSIRDRPPCDHRDPSYAEAMSMALDHRRALGVPS